MIFLVGDYAAGGAIGVATALAVQGARHHEVRNLVTVVLSAAAIRPSVASLSLAIGTANPRSRFCLYRFQNGATLET